MHSGDSKKYDDLEWIFVTGLLKHVADKMYIYHCIRQDNIFIINKCMLENGIAILMAMNGLDWRNA